MCDWVGLGTAVPKYVRMASFIIFKLRLYTPTNNIRTGLRAVESKCLY